MILAVDVNYRDNGALAAGIGFMNWNDNVPVLETTVILPEVEKYISGSFYLRELPCIIQLLGRVKKKPEIIVIDGYVWLGEEKKSGLGMHLFSELHGESGVIGVAKTKYKDTPDNTKIYRGKSKSPLYITSVGITEDEAKEYILSMYGPDRIPLLIKRADQLSRQLK